MKKLLQIFITLFLISPGSTYSQKLNHRKLENAIQKAIEKAYPASVSIWGFDTVANQQMSAQFSGVVVSADGHILTAAHVDVPGNTYKVMFPDGKECIAVGLGKIEFTRDRTMPDVAMMKIITKGIWPYAEMGSSSALNIYTPCISIAYPESLNQPKPIVRFGYIANVKNERGFIQSTCIMEPGDSGGPLFDCFGRVIGLHSAIEIAENDNYEVPVYLYKKYWSALNVAKIYTAFPAVADSTSGYQPQISTPPIPALKNFNITARQFTSQYNNSSLSVISINNNGEKEKATGTLFELKGDSLSVKYGPDIIVSKSSITGNYPVVILPGNRMITVKIIARDIKNDLVLLKPSAEIEGGIPFKKIRAGSPDIGPGRFLSSLLPGKTNVVSITGSKLFGLPKIHSNGFLGAAIAYDTSPLLITKVQPGSEAANIGLKTGDNILSINNITIDKAPDYATILQKYWPGDTVRLQLKRAGIVFTKTAVLGIMPKSAINHPAEFFAGGKSIRRDGFEQVFSHDAIIKPFECGGPVFDLYGNFYGINIARYSRASTLTIPASVIYSFIYMELKLKT